MRVRFKGGELKKRDGAFALTEGGYYIVLGIEANDYRLIDDTGEPYLWDHTWFDVIDPEWPSDWETNLGDDGERYSYPPEFARVGFFEDYFDRVEHVRNTFWQVVYERYGITKT